MGPPPPPKADQARRAELADFLKARRAALDPARAGFPTSGFRRTPGLRREEVAQRAGVGLSWYTWLEQARDVTPSAPVLAALGRALEPVHKRIEHPTLGSLHLLQSQTTLSEEPKLRLRILVPADAATRLVLESACEACE